MILPVGTGRRNAKVALSLPSIRVIGGHNSTGINRRRLQSKLGKTINATFDRSLDALTNLPDTGMPPETDESSGIEKRDFAQAYHRGMIRLVRVLWHAISRPNPSTTPGRYLPASTYGGRHGSWVSSPTSLRSALSAGRRTSVRAAHVYAPGPDDSARDDQTGQAIDD